jgi:hypothetical protein
MLEEGDTAPDFATCDKRGQQIINISLHSSRNLYVLRIKRMVSDEPVTKGLKLKFGNHQKKVDMSLNRA